MDSIFTQIINREIKARIIYEDSQCIAIDDANPQAPMHILIIPKEPLPMLKDTNATHEKLLGHLVLTANQIAHDLKTEDNYRIVINNGPDAGQSVYHLHVHLLAGRGMSWPPG